MEVVSQNPLRRLVVGVKVAIVVLAFAVAAVTTRAQTLTVLHTFTNGADGGTPYAGVAFDQQGRIYGTTYSGGSHRQGAVYRLVHEGGGWVLSPIYSFGSQSGDGSAPVARVVFGPDGLLYGTTSIGGTYDYGTVFSLRPPASACKTALCPWVETVIFNFDFTGGTYPGYGDLVFDQAGNIYGTAFNGGQGGGVVFELSRSGSGWTEKVLWQFDYGSDGAYPAGGVIFDTAGNLYGTTSLASSQDNGAVYELSPTESGWTEKTLYAFTNQDGEGSGSLTMDANGNLFGITGLFVPGVAYELTPQNGSWSYKVLQAFSGSSGIGPVAAPTFDSHGNLYGPLPASGSSEEGEIFMLTPSGNHWNYSPFYQFTTTDDGQYPFGAVTFDTNGNMYGTASGAGRDYGTVWEITP